MPTGVSFRRLVADVGGSNARFAIGDRAGSLAHVKGYRVADFASFLDALQAYRMDIGGRFDVDDCAVAAAGPVDCDRVKVTNNDWSIDCREIAAALGGIPAALINDLEAVAAALPHLALDDLAAVGGPSPVRPEQRTMLALNVGTGFGAASVMFRGGRWWTVPSEAGHMTLDALGENGGGSMAGDATIESVLSGRGIAALYRQLAAIGGQAAERLGDAEEVFVQVDRDAVAARTVERMTSVLGQVAGNLALASAAWGGIYFCGSVATAWAPLADAEQFRAAFIRKGPMRARLESMPTAVIRRDNVSLFGLAMLPVPG